MGREIAAEVVGGAARSEVAAGAGVDRVAAASTVGCR